MTVFRKHTPTHTQHQIVHTHRVSYVSSGCVRFAFTMEKVDALEIAPPTTEEFRICRLLAVCVCCKGCSQAFQEKVVGV